jgi:hypothetical protein
MIFSKKEKKEELDGKKSVKKSHLARYIFASFFILLLVLVEITYRLAQEPAKGVIVQSSEKENKIASLGSDVPESFTGKYISFAYGNKYALKSHETAKDGSEVILETAYFSESSSISKKINLTVRSLPSGKLEDCPDYKMREIKKERYKKEIFSEGSVKGESFVPADESQFEKTFFIQHEGLVAIIVMSAPASSDDLLIEEADTITKSLEWIKL